MKLLKRLKINGKEYQIVSEQVRLEANRPGVAIFQVLAPFETVGELLGDVSFSMGWHFDNTHTLYFTGEVKHATRVDNKQQRLLCLEKSARLDLMQPIALRHPTLKDVLTEYGNKIGVSFILPHAAYADIKVPSFYGFGSSFHALSTIGDVFHIPDYTWLTQGDGRIFCGSWADSFWKDKNIELPDDFFSNVSADGSKEMTVAPAIRPGAMLNKKRVQIVTFQGHKARIQWQTTTT